MYFEIWCAALFSCLILCIQASDRHISIRIYFFFARYSGLNLLALGIKYLKMRLGFFSLAAWLGDSSRVFRGLFLDSGNSCRPLGFRVESSYQLGFRKTIYICCLLAPQYTTIHFTSAHWHSIQTALLEPGQH